MNSVVKFLLVALFCGLFFLQNVIRAQDNPGGEPEKKSVKSANSNTSKSDVSEFEFPDVEGWEKNVVPNDPSTGLGDLANYDSEEGGRVTLYFYNGGRNLIPDDLKSKILRDEMINAKLGILQLGEMGVYKNIKEAKNDTVMLGGSAGKIKALHSLLYFSTGENDLVSEIFLFPYKNNFLKIRASRPKVKEKDNKAFETFLSEMDVYFSK